MRLLFLGRFPARLLLGGVALLGAAALAAPQYFRGNAPTIIVLNTNDSGPGSLRDTLAAANDGDTIQFDPALNGQTITLTSGELVIAKNITISGPGSNLLTASRSSTAANFRVFHVMANHTVTIQDLTISGGFPPGGGIFNEQATLTVDNCTVSNNVGTWPGSASGGGISNSGTLTITDSTISGNFTPNYGGGIFHTGTGLLTITHSTVSANAAGLVAGGIANDGMLNITDSIVSNNMAGRNGVHPSGFAGGLYNSTVGILTINNTIVRDNQTVCGAIGAQGGGIGSYGSLTIINSTISHNIACLNGGGIENIGSATITHSIITNNSTQAFQGGGISNRGTLNITDSTISSNQTAAFGGGIENSGTLTILGSTVSDNTATGGPGPGHTGGGISSSGSLGVSDSTISHNFALGEGGGIFNSAMLTIGNSTFSDNWTQNGNGGGITTGGTNATMEIGNTVLETGTSGANIFSNGGTVTSHGYNLSSDNGAGFLTGPGDQINTNPLLGPLQDNGGPAFTHNLLTGSPAIDTGDPNFTPPPATDQRGYARVFNGRIDIGSLEVQPTPTASPTPTLTPAPTATATATATATPINISGNISYCSNPVPGPVPNVTLTLTGSASASTLSNGSGNYQFSSLPSGGSYTVTPAKTAVTPGSNGITTVDVIATQRHFLNIGTPLSGCRLTAADVNADSAVTTVDVIAIQRFYIALPTGTANVGKYQFTPASRNYPGVISNQPGQNYDTLVFGDVVASFVE
jgi:hypothetical protein